MTDITHLDDFKPQHRFQVKSIDFGSDLGIRYWLSDEGGVIWYQGASSHGYYSIREYEHFYPPTESEAWDFMPSAEQIEIIPPDQHLWRLRIYPVVGTYEDFFMLNEPDISANTLEFVTLDRTRHKVVGDFYKRIEVKRV